MKIEIITTPNEGLKETGFGSSKSCLAVLKSIRKMGHSARLVMCKTREDLDQVVARAPDLVVLAVKYISVRNEENLWLSEFFGSHGINFSGSSREVLQFDSDKVLAKRHLERDGVRTAKFFTAIPDQFDREGDLPFLFPLFLKPLDAANGNGIDDLSLVTNFGEFQVKVSSLHDRFQVPILVEEYLDGPEFTVALIRTEMGELVVSPIEIVPPRSGKGIRILGEQAKREDSEELKKMGVTDLVARVKRLAVDAFEGLGVRDFGRVDVKTDARGQCYFMEANLVPGMTKGSSYFPRACEISHEITYDQVVQMIVNKCLSRTPAAVAAS